MRAISLVGAMGSGKTDVGRRLAQRLGWIFVDTDTEIVAQEGRSVADIFRDAGEAEFRRIERRVVRAAARRRGCVIATGGGAVLAAATRRALRAAGPVFWLRAPVDVLLQRVGSDPGRPLLGDDPRASLERLVREREPFYAETGQPLDAAVPVETIVETILSGLSTAAQRVIRVELGARGYAVRVGTGTLPLIGYETHGLGARGRVAVVTHRSLAARYGTVVVRALEGAGLEPSIMTVPVGEGAKSLRQASRLLDALAAAGFGRTETILALGGGVVGDLAGFVAGVYMRGLRLVHVPTTLLAQIDSSIGGKTAVNHGRAKNLIGVVHQPALVLADVDTLRSLPARERRAGLAEAVKAGMTLDGSLLETLEGVGTLLAEGFGAVQLADVVFRCAAAKARVVEQDEREQGPREVLNYGHTVGHAIEAAFPGRMVHGEAVAVGMRVEAQAAVRLGLLDAAAAERQNALLRRLALPVDVPSGPVIQILDAMRLDKKRREGRIRCTLPEGIGRARLGVEVPDALMEEVVRACQESS